MSKTCKIDEVENTPNVPVTNSATDSISFEHILEKKHQNSRCPDIGHENYHIKPWQSMDLLILGVLSRKIVFEKHFLSEMASVFKYFNKCFYFSRN